MSYQIDVHVYQPRNTNTYFPIVERTVWSTLGKGGGTWSETDGIQTLKMSASGTSGTLRFFSRATGENVLVAVGVHDDCPWCDITELRRDDTGVYVHPNYHSTDTPMPTLATQREKRATSDSLTTGPQRRKVSVAYTVKKGNSLEVNVVFD